MTSKLRSVAKSAKVGYVRERIVVRDLRARFYSFDRTERLVALVASAEVAVAFRALRSRE